MDATVSVWAAALRCRCPRCGWGRLFTGLLTERPRREACGLDFSEHDSGDGPAAGVIFALGTVIVALAFWVEFSFSPPLWVHVILWPLITFPLAFLLMRPAKAALIALPYRHRASEMGL